MRKQQLRRYIIFAVAKNIIFPRIWLSLIHILNLRIKTGRYTGWKITEERRSFCIFTLKTIQQGAASRRAEMCIRDRGWNATVLHYTEKVPSEGDQENEVSEDVYKETYESTVKD